MAKDRFGGEIVESASPNTDRFGGTIVDSTTTYPGMEKLGALPKAGNAPSFDPKEINPTGSGLMAIPGFANSTTGKVAKAATKFAGGVSDAIQSYAPWQQPIGIVKKIGVGDVGGAAADAADFAVRQVPGAGAIVDQGKQMYASGKKALASRKVDVRHDGKPGTGAEMPEDSTFSAALESVPVVGPMASHVVDRTFGTGPSQIDPSAPVVEPDPWGAAGEVLAHTAIGSAIGRYGPSVANKLATSAPPVFNRISPSSSPLNLAEIQQGGPSVNINRALNIKSPDHAMQEPAIVNRTLAQIPA